MPVLRLTSAPSAADDEPRRLRLTIRQLVAVGVGCLTAGCIAGFALGRPPPAPPNPDLTSMLERTNKLADELLAEQHRLMETARTPPPLRSSP